MALSADGLTLAVSADGTTTNQGKVYIYSRSGGTYVLPQTLSEPFFANGDNFGNAIALSADGSTLAVGAFGTTGQQGNAYVYTRSGTGYVSPQTLSDPGVTALDNFGSAVALSVDGSTLAVGAYVANKAYVFTRTGASYGLSQTLLDPGGVFNDNLGTALAMSGDGGTLAVGAPGASSLQGAMYVYTDVPALTADGATASQSATVGTTFGTTLAAHASDGLGNPLAGASVTFTAPASTASGTFTGGTRTAIVTSNANGLAVAPAFTAGPGAGNYTVTASVTNTAGTAITLFSLTNTAGAATSITPFSGSGQSAVLGVAFPAPLQAQVRDAHGNPVSGVTVTFAPPGGSNIPTVTFAAATALTDDAGIASVTATASGRPGTVTVTASVTGASTPASFGLTDTAAPTTLTLTSFSPPTGPTAGGTSVTIHGLNLAGITGVSFGGVPATSFSVLGGTVLIAVAPAHAAAGTVDISAITATQSATIRGYTYLDAGSIAPQPQPGGHPPAGNVVSGGIAPMVQPGRR